MDEDPRIARFTKLKAQFPQSEMPRWSLATTYEDAKRYPEAIRELEELVALKPNYCVAFIHLGNCLINEERYEDALRVLAEGHRLAIEQGHMAPKAEAEMLIDQAREELG